MKLSPINLEEFDSIIFDLGGVLLRLYPEKTVDAFSELFSMNASALYTQARQVKLFDQFERGEISPAEFRAGVSSLAQGESDAPKLVFDEALNRIFDQAWNAMLGQFQNENLQLLGELGRDKRVFLLSNTNETHIDQFLFDYKSRHESTHGPWQNFFEEAHYSHHMGMRKPELRIFEHLLEKHQLDPSRTVFLDDNQANCDAAAQAGIRGIYHSTNSPLPSRFAKVSDVSAG